MNKRFIDSSGKIEPYAHFLDTLEKVKTISSKLNIPFFVVGAVARDIVLRCCYGCGFKRATEDIDLGIRVKSIEEFKEFSDGLVDIGGFRKDKCVHRFYNKEVPVDIVPFGLLANPDMYVKLPDDHLLNVLGFEEAYEGSIIVRVRSNPNLDINFASLECLALLKIIAWNDKPSERGKDALDLFWILKNYIDAGNLDRLYEEEADLVREFEGDNEKAGARLIGRDMAAISDRETINIIVGILSRETGEEGYKLATAMQGADAISKFEDIVLLLKEIKEGIFENLK